VTWPARPAVDPLLFHCDSEWEVLGTSGGPTITPFAFSDGTCDFCQESLQTACTYGGYFGVGTVGGAQAEAVRIAYSGANERGFQRIVNADSRGT
jgi:threonine dehydrogenase-like Zn-dependent dehydrogenase